MAADSTTQIAAASARHRAHGKLLRLHGVVGDVRRNLERDGAALEGFGSEGVVTEKDVRGVGEVVGRLRALGLTRGEVLVICNLRPRSVAEVEAVVEEWEERFVDGSGAGGGGGGLEEVLRVVGEGIGVRGDREGC